MTTADQARKWVFAGESAAVERLRVQVARIAPHYRIALVTGEAGTGKEMVARELHRLSPVGCGEFFSYEAGGAVGAAGTVWVRDVHGFGLAEQDGLLQVLGRLGRGIRVVLTAEVDLRGMVAAGRMRVGLFERLGGLAVRVPALRERLEDLPALLGEMRVEPGVLEGLAAYRWPGNLGELRGLLDGVEGVFRVRDVPSAEAVQSVGETRLEVVMRRHVADVLELCAGNKLRASEMLGISRSTLYRMLDSLAG